MSGPLTRYRARVARGELKEDPAQKAALEALQSVHVALETMPDKQGVLGRFFRAKPQEGPKGLYLWGGVGRGKSMLMDLFFETAPVRGKRRVHFHAFMAEIHDGLSKARAAQMKDPLAIVAGEVTRDLQLLCFDELQITDITDAMIVGRLFEKLFEAGVTIVTTSNRVPDDLYKDGLNRKLFLPFIDLIKAQMRVLELVSETDHRRAALQAEQLYFHPLDKSADAAMDALWARLAGGTGAPLVLTNKGRAITIPRMQSGIGRGTFPEFCAQPYGPSDFLMIAQAVSVLFVDHVPRLGRAGANEAKRFVTLVDALYEAQTRIIVSAGAPPEALYEEGAGAFEFERTASRLMEMGSGSWP